MDYCLEERKLVFFLLKETDHLFSQENEDQIINPNFDLKVKLLELDNWTVGIINSKEFESLKEKKSEWLK